MSPAHTKLENEPGLEVWYSSELIFSSVEQKHFFLLSFTTVLHISLVLPLPKNFQKSRQSKISSEAKLLSEL